MATTFLEPGGDADFLIGTTNGFWGNINFAPAVVTDFVHGSHVKSLKYFPNDGGTHTSDQARSPLSSLADAGSRISFYLYVVTLPDADAAVLSAQDSALLRVFSLRMTSAGILQLVGTAKIGSNGPTLSTGVWYHISIAYTITSTTVNRFEVFVNSVPAISVTNGTLTRTGSSVLGFGNINGNTALDFRTSDHYVDNSSALTDTGNIWVTAKRPASNGATNGFTTQIGAGGSGYGSGHSPQVNERALSLTNGWSMIGSGSTVTEEYTIQGKSVGDTDITPDTIVDYVGWVSASALTSITASIKVGGTTSNIALTSTTTMFKKVKGSSTYPAGATDIGIVTDTTLTTVSLYECGILVAYIPRATANSLMMMGSGI